MAIPNSFQILQAVMEATPDAIFVKDLEGRYVLVNEAAARFLGKSPDEIIGKHDLELYPEETARQFIEDDRKVLESGNPHVFEGVATSETDRQAYLVTKGVYRNRDGAIIGLFGISHDITELRHAQETLEQTREALFRSQKMEAVGQLTGGIAHDFNNILAIILGNVELLRAYLPKDTYADEIIDASAIDDDVKPGTYVRLSLQDTGGGMPPEIAARVFEPFFTTKAGGRGTGLGLSMVYGFAKQSGGTVTIASQPGRGTTVTMLLPLASGDARSSALSAAPVSVSATPRTILVVEDESEVRSIVRRQLESLGHKVLVAEGTTEALLLIQGPGAPDVLLTDVGLAEGMDGIALAEAARGVRPGLPVIFISGFTAVPEAQQRIRNAGAPLLSKPFSTPQLEHAIGAVLRQERPRRRRTDRRRSRS